jgi:hypothetical protein
MHSTELHVLSSCSANLRKPPPHYLKQFLVLRLAAL